MFQIVELTMPWRSAALCLCCVLSGLLWSLGNGVVDCESRATCSECITVDLACGWCADEGVRIDGRCRLNSTDTSCDTVFAPLSEIEMPAQPTQATSISPEGYNISLRNTDTLSLPIDITTGRNIPLDLYILFDVSQSMEEEITAIQGASDEIINRLSMITTDVQVGVGSYVDKATLPFSRRNLTQESGCIELGGPCYNFRHYGAMTSNRDELTERFARIVTGSNIDAPEAGLDAMAQAVICYTSVGWRDAAVKMILTFTDDAFKFAGEGRQGGILTPFDSVCGLINGTDNYTMYSGLDNDYTSPGELLNFLELSNIIPVFVSVTSSAQAQGFYDVAQTHQELARLFNLRLNGRASIASVNTTGTDQTGIANSILSIIDEQVLFTLSRTGLNPDRINGLSFSVQADCPSRAIKLDEGTPMESCSNVTVGDTSSFTLSVTLEDCDDFSETREVVVNVFPLGRVIIEIMPICSCLCDDYEVNSSRCSFNGNYSCGECTCKEGYCGLRCQFRDRMECPVGLGNEMCSGDRGVCLGTCECVCQSSLMGIVTNEKITRIGVNASAFGPACECDYFTCLPDDNLTITEVCSGFGDCCNGECVCHFDENGNQYRSDGTDNLNCRCKPAEVVCQPSLDSTPPCTGVGTCGCESCNCPAPYTKPYCQDLRLDCFAIGSEPEIENCILKEKMRTNRDQCQSCQFNAINTVNISCVLIIPPGEQPQSAENEDKTIEEFAARILGGDGTSYKNLGLCSFTDNDTCTHDYYVVYNKDDISEIVFVAEEQRTCLSRPRESFQLPIELWELALILLGLLFLLGVIILAIIKGVFLLLDYFEVKRLEKEVGMADFSKNQNPLYQSPDVEYKNVAYGKE